MRKSTLIKFFLLCLCFSLGHLSEARQQNTTVTYEEGIAVYRNLAQKYRTISMREMGLTDSGKPLHLVIYSQNGDFDFKRLHASGKPIFLINNAIHAGEPDGVNASIRLLTEIAEGSLLKKEVKDLVLAIIPFYNIGGVLNRNSTTRVNQNGPEAYGFRGNARNYDLNRDFIKGDTRNAQSFWELFQEVDPDFFLDTHVSNGADYQYAITLIASQKDKLSKPMRDVMEQIVKPDLYKYMESVGEVMTPFVNVYGTTPDNGFSEFADWPRYSTGYAALFNTYGFMSETHMLKPFHRRVNATYHLMVGMCKNLWKYREKLLDSRKAAKNYVATQQQSFAIKWKLDQEYQSMINFKGYEGSYIDSKLTGQKRLFYDRSSPYEKDIPYRNRYLTDITVEKPAYYVVPQGWHEILSLLSRNGVAMKPIESDTSILVSAYQLTEYKTASMAYEGHYPHYAVKVKKQTSELYFNAGDVLIPMDQPTNRFVIETLEPEAEDSYFKWNKFDMVLSRKEGFSSYVFEELAEEVLARDGKLAEEYRNKQQSDPEFAASRYSQLDWIYEKSVYREPAYLRYPVFRIE